MAVSSTAANPAGIATLPNSAVVTSLGTSSANGAVALQTGGATTTFALCANNVAISGSENGDNDIKLNCGDYKPESATSNGGKSLVGKEIAGIVVSIAVVIIAAITLWYACHRKRGKKKAQAMKNTEQEPTPGDVELAPVPTARVPRAELAVA